MTKNQTTNIDKQIMIQKSDFLSQHSTFFYKNLANDNILNCLKNILLNPAPLSQCADLPELVEEFRKNKTRNINEFCYQYSFEVLFGIIKMVRSNSNLGENTITEQVEKLRLYVKYISMQTTESIYYINQNMVTIDTNKAMDIVEKDNQYIKERRNR